jgi:hypothetical protein
LRFIVEVLKWPLDVDRIGKMSLRQPHRRDRPHRMRVLKANMLLNVVGLNSSAAPTQARFGDPVGALRAERARKHIAVALRGARA